MKNPHFSKKNKIYPNLKKPLELYVCTNNCKNLSFLFITSKVNNTIERTGDVANVPSNICVCCLFVIHI